MWRKPLQRRAEHDRPPVGQAERLDCPLEGRQRHGRALLAAAQVAAARVGFRDLHAELRQVAGVVPAPALPVALDEVARPAVEGTASGPVEGIGPKPASSGSNSKPAHCPGSSSSAVAQPRHFARVRGAAAVQGVRAAPGAATRVLARGPAARLRRTRSEAITRQSGLSGPTKQLRPSGPRPRTRISGRVPAIGPNPGRPVKPPGSFFCEATQPSRAEHAGIAVGVEPEQIAAARNHVRRAARQVGVALLVPVVAALRARNAERAGPTIDRHALHGLLGGLGDRVPGQAARPAARPAGVPILPLQAGREVSTPMAASGFENGSAN